MPSNISKLMERGTGVFVLVLLFFLVSGGCGLLYQVVWTRKLVLLFGTTSYAVSTVLAIFFVGLGVGSLWGGRLADRRGRPLFLYGIFEIVIGLWAVGFIVFVGAGESAVVSILRETGSSRGMGILLRAIMALAFMIVPVGLMGATLPLLAKYVTREMAVRGRRVGLLYSINTFGAVAGALLAGFVLLPAYGYTLSTYMGAAANILVGVFALAVSRRTERAAAPEIQFPKPETRPAAALTSRIFVATVCAFGVSGFCAIALEVLWTRLLVLLFSGTTYAYTTMLATMLFGIAAGSALAAPIADRVRSPVGVFGLILALNGTACLAMLPVFGLLPDTFVDWASTGGWEWDSMLRVQFWICFLALLPPTLFFGMGFPFAVRAAATERQLLGREVGILYSANTFSGVLGAVAGGYLIIPTLGTHNGIVVLSGLLFLAGVLLLSQSAPWRIATRSAVAGTAVGLFAVAWFAAPADVSRVLNEWYVPEDATLIEYREGVEGTVAVVDPNEGPEGKNRTIYINRVQATATIERGVRMNRFQGVLPMLFDRRPKDVLFMCFGSGTTVGALAQWDFDRIDAVEISQDVLDVAPYFALDNLNVLENSKVNFIVDDGRNFLLTSEDTYDIITFEPMPLALSGVSTFYTQEYYELCRSHLTNDGLVSQWVPLHSLNPEVVRSLVYTFTTVFPHYSAWFINADLFLIGSNNPQQVDFALLEERLQQPQIRAALEPVGLNDPIELVNMFILDESTIDRFCEGGRVMRDDRPWAEFIAPALAHEQHVVESLELLEGYIQPPSAIVSLDGIVETRRDEVREAIATRHASHRAGYEGLITMRTQFGMATDAEEAFLRALEIDPQNKRARHYLKDMLGQKMPQFIHWGGDELERAVTLLERATALVPDEPMYIDLLDQARDAMKYDSQ